jgi:hypothetical protein
VSWLSRIFGSTKQEPSSLDIVTAYGSALENAPLGWTGVRDIADLPFEKARIKEALLEAAKEFRDYPEQIEVLGAGFVMLGGFQPLSNDLMQMPNPEDIEAMNEEQFKQHIQGMVGRKDGDMSDSRTATAESAELLAEWTAHLNSLGIANA